MNSPESRSENKRLSSGFDTEHYYSWEALVDRYPWIGPDPERYAGFDCKCLGFSRDMQMVSVKFCSIPEGFELACKLYEFDSCWVERLGIGVAVIKFPSQKIVYWFVDEFWERVLGGLHTRSQIEMFVLSVIQATSNTRLGDETAKRSKN